MLKYITEADLLLEMKSKEENRRESFKKKYNFEPDKPGSNTGTITDKNGEKFTINLKSKNSTGAFKSDKDIDLGKDFYKFKGSNKSERRDAALGHEITHVKLHDTNPDSKHTPKEKRTPEVYHATFKAKAKEQGIPIDHKKIDSEILTKGNFTEYQKYLEKSAHGEDKEKRNTPLKRAESYETKAPHNNAIEIEADRGGANRSSDSAMKKAIRDGYKEAKKHYIKSNKDTKEYNRNSQEEIKQRSKALKDKELKKSDIYK